MTLVLSLWRGLIECPRSLSHICHEVASRHDDVSEADIRGKSRYPEIVEARLEFYYRALTETEKTAVQIGRWCGGRNHTTVLDCADAHAQRNGLPYARNRGRLHAESAQGKTSCGSK